MGREEIKCRHIYELVNSPTCPDCDQPTHEIDWALEQQIIRDWRASGKGNEHLCSVDGGTIRGWWDI